MEGVEGGEIKGDGAEGRRWNTGAAQGRGLGRGRVE